MKKKFVVVAVVSICMFIVMTSGIALFIDSKAEKSGGEYSLVLLNEIEQLTTPETGENPAQDMFVQLKSQLRQESSKTQNNSIRQTAAVCMMAAVFYLLLLFGYLYSRIFHPLCRIENYADRIAKGDMDFPLEMERGGFFEAFIWALDHMRKEIGDTRKKEKRAVDENKTIIATLSHDIKTPIASIRAYAEGLEANLEAGYEQRERYLQVIIRKCDEVTRLTNDLVLHSLSELERLTVNRQRVVIDKVLTETLQDLESFYVVIKSPFPKADVWGDEKRIAQVLLNLLENAWKYAPNEKVEVWAVLLKECYEIHVRDYGKGIRPEDMPFVFEKFYRGKNVEDKPGSGLGLYIVYYIMEKMGGGVTLFNHEDGLEAVVWLERSFSPKMI